MSTPITCLGKTFTTEDERRSYFIDELRKQLPELRKIEGFPIGTDDDILNLSDPPYYTACPNPWLNNFIAQWEEEKKGLEKNNKRKADFEVHEPYASDVKEGKNNPIYNAHSYHTKVPHPAIMRYILHYTQPGDIVFDGFAGTGMTGVASQHCANADFELIYKIETEFKQIGLLPPIWGARKAICSDLSPIASFIATNYNTIVNVSSFKDEAYDLLKKILLECGWMYSTRHSNGKLAHINYTAWSEVYICSSCGSEIVFWDAAVEKIESEVFVNEELTCSICNAKQKKKYLDRALETTFDPALKVVSRTAKTVPVLINYTYNRKRFEKQPDNEDLAQIDKINHLEIQNWYPKGRMPEGGETRRNDDSGITHIHHFYTKRTLYVLSVFKAEIEKLPAIRKNNHLFVFTSMLPKLTRMNRYMPQHGSRALVGPMANTLYIPPLSIENEVLSQFEFQLKKIIKAFNITKRSVVQIKSATISSEIENKVDYIFVDPPFGANIAYSELNTLSESWIKLLTNNDEEAIVNTSQNKSNYEYQKLMISSFDNFYKALKPGKWMTVEFSNTSSAIWNLIHYSLQKVGFVIANVSAINKERPGLQGMIGPVAVNQDLVISCYKPSSEFTDVFTKESGDNVWTFIEEHLRHLPISIVDGKKTTAIIERSPKILYDRLITFYLMRGLQIPIDASDFQIKLKQKFRESDGMYFTAEQQVHYEDQKIRLGITHQLSLVFDIIYSESDAVDWLKARLAKYPQKYNEIMPDFRKANTATRKGEKEFELQTLLNENFIPLPDGCWRVPDMNEAKDREHFRTTALLKEFGRYLEELANPKTKKLKDVRVKALRAGFKSCWEKKEFTTIVNVAEKIPQNLLMEDEQLLMFYDIAKDKV